MSPIQTPGHQLERARVGVADPAMVLGEKVQPVGQADQWAGQQSE